MDDNNSIDIDIENIPKKYLKKLENAKNKIFNWFNTSEFLIDFYENFEFDIFSYYDEDNETNTYVLDLNLYYNKDFDFSINYNLIEDVNSNVLEKFCGDVLDELGFISGSLYQGDFSKGTFNKIILDMLIYSLNYNNFKGENEEDEYGNEDCDSNCDNCKCKDDKSSEDDDWSLN